MLVLKGENLEDYFGQVLKRYINVTDVINLSCSYPIFANTSLMR